ncbi:hypothetical protein GWI33_009171 [Rhynchophorus ferrugineus]|uniref:Invertebrate defensins family profile domain-containing protein n=1 Tax=Rhynchophorus ferrugineus TaxID=354439 RepID=A0A834IH16_RHYFE|nr:hypothetical protein GWI33_009171 [Rhynchophorus ferrugineus]
MNNIRAILLIFLIVFSVSAYCKPLLDDFETPSHEGRSRVKRATCQLGKFRIFGMKYNDSLCAAHCLVIGKKGGYCNRRNTCICRK